MFARISLLERLQLEASAKHAGRKKHMHHASGVVPPGSTTIRSGFSSLGRRHARDALIRLHESLCWNGSCSRLCRDLPVGTAPARGFAQISLLERLLLEAFARHAGQNEHMLHARGADPPGSARIRLGGVTPPGRIHRRALVEMHGSTSIDDFT